MATFNGQVSTGADDGYVTTGPTYEPSLDFVSFGKQSTTIVRSTWLRFQNVTIPQGSTINSATLSMRAFVSASTTTVNVTIRCFDEDNPTAISSESDYTGRDSTTAVVNWNNIGAWTADTWYDAPDLASVVQEIVDRGGWSSGNAIMFRIVDNSSSADARRTPYAYEGGSASAATIEIDYTEPFQNVGMMHIASTATVHTPGITPGSVSVGMNTIAATSETYQPGVEPGSVSVGMNAIAADTTVHEPGILLGISTIGMNHIAATSTTHTPGVQYDQSAGMEHIAATSEAHEPGVQYSQPVGMNHIALTATLYQPAASVGEVIIGMEAIGSTAVLYAPGALYDQAIAMNAIASGSVLYQPLVAPEQVVGMNTIASGATLYLMTITAGPKTTTILVASPRRDPHFYVTLYPHPGRPNENQRLDWIDINPDLTGLSWTTTTPGGYAQLRAGHNNYERPLANPLIPREMHWQDFARIEVTDGALVLFEGRTEDREESPKARRTLTAAGWGYSAVHDMPFFSDSSTEATTGDVLRTVLAYAAPFIRPASGDLYVDPLVEHAPSEFDAWYPSQVLDQITKEGDDDGNLMDWWVWESRALWLRPRVAPATADYYLPFDRRYVTDWRRHVKDRRGVVWVDHTVSGVATRTGPITAPGFTSDIGFQRGRVLKVGEMSVSAATRLGQTHLAFHSGERYTGVVEIGPDDVLIGAGGRPVPAYMARAGQWVQVGDYGPLMIVVQEYNANARRQRLTLGDRLDSYEVKVAQTIRDAELRLLGSNPLGGRT